MMAKTVGAQMHVDAQVAGKSRSTCMKPKLICCRFLVTSSMPKGDWRFLRRVTRLGSSITARLVIQERGRRAGTENAASATAMGKAAELAYQAIDTELWSHQTAT